MRKYSSIISDLNGEMVCPEVQILIHEDPVLLSALHKLQKYLLEKAHHDYNSPSQEILCWEMLCSLRKKKQAVKKKTRQVVNAIEQLPEDSFSPVFKQYMNAVALIAPGDADTLLRLLE